MSGSALSGSIATAAADYAIRKEKNRHVRLTDPKNDHLFHIVNEELIESHGNRYEFRHKAIWACDLLLPKGADEAINFINRASQTKVVPEHWAFVARGVDVASPELHRIAFFIAQFGYGQFIPPVGELKSSNKKSVTNTPISPPEIAGSSTAASASLSTIPFEAWLQEESKNDAALRIVENPDEPAVWIERPNLCRGRYVSKGKKLMSAKFLKEEWTTMTPMKLRELNDCMYKTNCTGIKYVAIGNNCQDFAKGLFELIP